MTAFVSSPLDTLEGPAAKLHCARFPLLARAFQATCQLVPAATQYACGAAVVGAVPPGALASPSASAHVRRCPELARIFRAGGARCDAPATARHAPLAFI